jgi:hypothetical protein
METGNLLADAASALTGAGTGGLIVFGVMKTKVEKNTEDLKNILANAVFQRQCNACRDNWKGQTESIRSEIRGLRDELHQIITLIRREWR